MADTIHDAVWDWLLTCPHIKDLFFNFSQFDPQDTILIPSDSLSMSFIGGNELRNYDFILARVMPISFDPNDTGNIESMIDVEALIAWVKQQDDARNYPAMPAGITVNEISVLPDESGYVSAQDENRAKYQINFRIEYLKEA